MKKSSIALIVVVLVVAAGVGLLVRHEHANAKADAAVRATVTGFGGQLKNVSLLSPTVANQIEAAYGPYVDPTLLAKWKNDPSSTPGRETSSPWPDHITIDYVHMIDSSTYEAKGYVALLTSNEVEHGGTAIRVPVAMTLKNENDSWKITAYTEYDALPGISSSPAASSTPATSTPAR